MWPLLLLIAVATTVADDTGMTCPGLQATVLAPQCINDIVTCPQNTTWEPKSKVCNMCDGCTAYLREYEVILIKIRLQFGLENGASGVNICRNHSVCYYLKYQVPCHEDIWGNGGRAPCILNIAARGK